MRKIAYIALLMPSLAFAAGGDDDNTPTPTPTTQVCGEGKVYDANKGRCTPIQDSRLSPDDQMKAVRELAYAGRIGDAQDMLDLMPNQQADLVLTYRGFTARKLGDMDGANRWYSAALKANPDNLLARSYMGQGYVEAGEMKLAQAQLSEIRARGGRGTWAELSLRMALDSGRGYSY